VCVFQHEVRFAVNVVYDCANFALYRLLYRNILLIGVEALLLDLMDLVEFLIEDFLGSDQAESLGKHSFSYRFYQIL
jgi:hypothetical protein